MSEKNLLIVILREEIKIDELSIKKYLLKEKGITIAQHYFSHEKNINKKDMISQINLIIKFQKTLMGCKFNGLNRIGSVIGKEVEDFKVQLKKLEKNYVNIVDKQCKNELEKFILLEGKRMIQKGRESIDYIYNHDYLGIIERSMNREEICLGKVDQSNLKEIDGKIQIGSIKGMTYNLVEEDLYRYIKKLQRKQIYIDEEELIKNFVYSSHLSVNSIYYLRGLCNYPKDFLKTWERYIQNKKGKTYEDFLQTLQKSIEYENNNFII